MQDTSLECWICGNNPSSGEHHIKKSDLKRLYPFANQKSPIYHRQNGVHQRLIKNIEKYNQEEDK